MRPARRLDGCNSVWVTKDRRSVVVKDMGDKHLLNTLRVLAKQSPHGTEFRFHSADMRRQWLSVLGGEARARGLLGKAEDALLVALVVERLLS